MVRFRVNSKAQYNIPQGITEIYDVTATYDCKSIRNIVCSKTTTKKGKVRFFATFQEEWDRRKYKHYVDTDSPDIKAGWVEAMEKAIEEYNKP